MGLWISLGHWISNLVVSVLFVGAQSVASLGCRPWWMAELTEEPPNNNKRHTKDINTSV